MDATFSLSSRKKNRWQQLFKHLSGKRKNSFFFIFAQQGFLLSECHTCSSSGFKGHTGAIFCDTGLAGNGTSILLFHCFKTTASPHGSW